MSPERRAALIRLLAMILLAITLPAVVWLVWSSWPPSYADSFIVGPPVMAWGMLAAYVLKK
jgi:hypothetical protein